MNNATAISNLIYEIRGQKVMLDSDLAGLYEVPVGALNQAVKRNKERFPADFMFQLTADEVRNLKSQFVISSLENREKSPLTLEKEQNLKSQFVISSLEPRKKGQNLKSQIVTSSWGGRRIQPYAFTEHGILMLSSVLNSPRAMEVNITVMRIFVQMRQFVLQNAPHLNEIKELKQMLLLHIENTDTRFHEHGERIAQIIEVLNNLIEHPPPRRRIGFHAGNDGE